jgi:hypothetical protein
MRTILVSLAAVLCLCLVNSAQAERRMFIISNGALGKGAQAATAYCKSQEFAEASSFRKVDRDDITGAIPSSGSGGCKGPKCDDFVAIVCTR